MWRRRSNIHVRRTLELTWLVEYFFYLLYLPCQDHQTGLSLEGVIFKRWAHLTGMLARLSKAKSIIRRASPEDDCCLLSFDSCYRNTHQPDKCEEHHISGYSKLKDDFGLLSLDPCNRNSRQFVRRDRSGWSSRPVCVESEKR